MQCMFLSSGVVMDVSRALHGGMALSSERLEWHSMPLSMQVCTTRALESFMYINIHSYIFKIYMHIDKVMQMVDMQAKIATLEESSFLLLASLSSAILIAIHEHAHEHAHERATSPQAISPFIVTLLQDFVEIHDMSSLASLQVSSLHPFLLPFFRSCLCMHACIFSCAVLSQWMHICTLNAYTFGRCYMNVYLVYVPAYASAIKVRVQYLNACLRFLHFMIVRLDVLMSRAS